MQTPGFVEILLVKDFENNETGKPAKMPKLKGVDTLTNSQGSENESIPKKRLLLLGQGNKKGRLFRQPFFVSMLYLWRNNINF